VAASSDEPEDGIRSAEGIDRIAFGETETGVVGILDRIDVGVGINGSICIVVGELDHIGDGVSDGDGARVVVGWLSPKK
jgi:hypothetical protein